MDAVALAAFGVFALLDWLAVSRRIRALEYVAKPATLLALLAYAAFGHASPWLVAALAFSLLGDIFLMLPADLFLAGLAAFLIAHLAYIGAFAGALVPRLPWLAVVLVVLAPVAVRILRAVPEQALRVPVALYSLAIALMVASAIASASTVAIVGAVLFLVSDMLIAWNRFVHPRPWAPLAIIVTYHLGQLGLAAALRG